LIFNQLWHVGRISHPALQPDHMLAVAPSAITPQGKAFIENERGEGELVPFVRPRALDFEEMPYLVRQYERAAINAHTANFDGVEIHAANGYLLDQFIESGTNRRGDAYGGSVEHRMRLLSEVTEALVPIWGADCIGVRLSPMGKMNDIYDDDPRERQVLDALVAGQPNKIIAFHLRISVRTVEVHRARMMDRLGVSQLGEAVRLAVLATLVDEG
jgi:N-ethylmaleimide reductase